MERVVDIEKASQLANQYGLATVLCLIVVGVLVWVLKWVFDSSNAREKAMATIINVGLANLASSMTKLSESINANTAMIQEVSREMKIGFERMGEAARYQRDEHRLMIDKIDENSCKAD